MLFHVLLFAGVLREDGQLHLHVLNTIQWGAKVEILDIHTHELCIFRAEDTVPYYLKVVRSADLVVSSPGYAIRLPPAVIRTMLGSSFCGLKSTTIRA